MTAHVLERRQLVPRPVEEVFAFFSEAVNLARITPKWMNFRILEPRPAQIKAGTRLNYVIGWHGLPLRWTTEILAWSPPRMFVDVQLRGPYRVWHHTHTFEPVDGGTLMTDVVRYQLPLGPIGALIHQWKVRKDVEAIFDHRRDCIACLFPRDRSLPVGSEK